MLFQRYFFCYFSVCHPVIFSPFFKFDLSDWFVDWPHIVSSAMIDTFFCVIEAPELLRHEYYNLHYYGHGLKYQVVIAIGCPRICALSLGFRGSASDVAIWKKSGVLEHMRDDEVFLADKLYRGDPSKFITPCPGKRNDLSEEDKARNFLIYEQDKLLKE